MDTKKTDQALSALATKFKQDLIAELSSKGHKHSGKLAASIVFSFRKNGDKTVIELSCLSYIKYLEKGDFIKKFLESKQKEIEVTVKKNIKKDIIDFLKQ